jgi:tetratricopeptide (TPR) repeat protein
MQMNRRERRRAAHHQRTVGGAGPSKGSAMPGPDLMPLAQHHHNSGRYSEAAEICRIVLASDPDNAEGHLILGSAALNCNALDIARTHLERSISRRPHDARAWIVLSSYFSRVGDSGAAFRACERAIDIAPQLAVAHAELGNVLASQRKYDLAADAFRRGLALDPNDANAHVNLGSALYFQGHFDEAAASQRRALALDPGHPAALKNLGAALRQLGYYAEALASYRQATLIASDFADAHRDQALLLLLLGHFDEGWQKYEWRWKASILGAPPLQGRRWNGEDLAGRRILLQSEQGIGDTLQFMRFAPLVAERGGNVILQLPSSLIRLRGEAVAAARQIAVVQDELPQFDCYIPLMSLPRIFSVTADTALCRIPYLQAPSSSAHDWRQEFAAEALYVGVAWAGNPDHENDLIRSIPLMMLRPLFAEHNARFYSLQVGHRAMELRNIADDAVRDLSERLTDFGETASAVEALDLVITVDTAVAHLAGALGKPVWLLLSHVPDWRWQLEREDTPWYPSMRLYRQERRGDWEEVISRVKSDLALLAAQTARHRYNQ